MTTTELDKRPNGPFTPAILLLGIAGLFAATAFEGSTTHTGAFVLRLLTVVLCISLWPRSPWRLAPIHLACILLALFAAAWGFVRASNPGFALQPFITVLLGAVLYAVLTARSSFGTTPRQFDVLGPLQCILVSVGAVHGLWAIVEGIFFKHSRPDAGFFNANDLAAFLVPLIAISLRSARRSTQQKILWGVAGVVMAIAVLIGASRSGVLALFFSACIIGIGHTQHRMRAGIIGLVVGTLLAIQTWWRWSAYGDAYAYARFDIWRSSVDIALNNPLGVGLNGFRAAIRKIGVPLAGNVRYPKIATNPHSELIGAWVELGWLGLLCCFIATGIVLMVIRRHAKNHKTLAWEHLGMFLTFLIPAAVSQSLHIPVVAAVAALWLADLTRESCALTRHVWHVVPVKRFGAAVLLSGVLVAGIPGAASSIAVQRSEQLRAAHQPDRALAWAHFAARSAPWSPGAALMEESLRFRQGDDPIAIAERLADLSDRFDQDPEPPSRSAWLLENVARSASNPQPILETAVILRRAAAEREPKNALRWLALGRTQLLIGAFDDASRALQTAIDVEPHYANAHGALAKLSYQRGRQDMAIQHKNAAFQANELARGQEGRSRSILHLDSKLRDELMDLEIP